MKLTIEHIPRIIKEYFPNQNIKSEALLNEIESGRINLPITTREKDTVSLKDVSKLTWLKK